MSDICYFCGEQTDSPSLVECNDPNCKETHKTCEKCVKTAINKFFDTLDYDKLKESYDNEQG